ncbi:MAG TPA: alpha/beta fold hydrolase [Gemmatimonadaceae bacterium]|nr:alpha/beta fold hydrolase [Gemmatimonadaceae bacterium]
MGAGLRLRILESGDAAGRPVLLLHGWGMSAYSFRAALPTFAAAGFRAVAVDQTGHGLSDKPWDLACYARESMIAAAGAVLDAMDARDALVVGVSMGGGVAAGLAVAHHPRVGRVALVNPVGFAPVRFTTMAQVMTPLRFRHHASRLVSRPLVRLMLRLAYADASRISERDVEEYWGTASQPGAAAALVALLHRFSWHRFAEADLRGIGIPALLVVGTHDHLIVGSERHAAHIPGLRVMRVAGGHLVNEERPEVVDAALVSFARE